MAESADNVFGFENPDDVLRRFGYHIGSYIEDRLAEADSRSKKGSVLRFDCQDILGHGVLAPNTSSQNIGRVLSVLESEVENLRSNGMYRIPIEYVEDLAAELKDIEPLPTYQREIAMIERILKDTEAGFEKVADIQSELEKELEKFDEKYAENFSYHALQNRIDRTDRIQNKEGKWVYE